MLFKLIGKKIFDSAHQMAYHLVPERFADAPADLRDTRSIRHLAADGSLLSFSVTDKDLLDPPNLVAEVYAIISLILVILASGMGGYWILLAYIPAVLMGRAGFSNAPSKDGASTSEKVFGFVAILPPIVIGFYSHSQGNINAAYIGFAAFFLLTFVGLFVSRLFSNEKGNQANSMYAAGLILGIAAIYFGGFFTLLFAGVCLHKVFSTWKRMEQERSALQAHSAGLFNADVAADAVHAISEAEVERKFQNERALEDKTTFFPVAAATGLLSQKGDAYASERGQVIGITENDLTTHVFVFGKTGTGKTATLLRPMYKRWKDACIGGALILDGKGDLPTEFAQGNSNFFLLDPADPNCHVNLIQGLEADEIASVIVQVMSDPSKKSDFWVTSAEEVIKYSALCLQFARKKLLDPSESDYFAWNLSNLLKVVTNMEYRTQVLDRCKKEIESATPLVHAAHRYLSEDFVVLATDTKSGIVQTATAMMAPIASQEQIYRWSSSIGEGFEIESVLRGAHVGIAAPEYKYGKPGLAVQALMKARIYRAIRQRGSKWTEIEGQKKVLMMMDECQELLGPQDNIFAVARSLGLTAVCATQTIEGLNAVLTKDNAAALLGNFRNLVCFMSSPETLAYMSERMGSAAVRVEHENIGISYDKMLSIADSGGAVHGVGRDFKDERPGVAATYKIEIKKVATPEELSFMLSPRFSAACIFNRANAPRRSIAFFEIGGIE